MNIYSSSQQDQIASPDNLSQMSWNKVHQSSEQVLEKSKKIHKKRPPQDVQQKWFSIQKISSCKLDISEQNDLDLRDQNTYQFDYLKLDQHLLSKNYPIIVNMSPYAQIEDLKSKKKYQIKPISIKSDIIEVYNLVQIIQKLFSLNNKFILTPENIFTYSAQTQKIDDLAKEIKILHISFQLLVYQYCRKTIFHFLDELTNKQIKTIFLDLIQGLISAQENQLVLKQITLDSILYYEDTKSFKLIDYTEATIGNNRLNFQDLGFCLAQTLQIKNPTSSLKNTNQPINQIEWLQKNNEDHLSSVALYLILNEKPIEEIVNLLQQNDT
ncbi:unnamed protein product (macronuclear) [Paramecium tetraurelia]|uniref:Protein kinase domain-containing protein n=1 Tax=Paramecium tetraurelia TaxID=5888 RepID=A0DE44_PARTE|nr:uncharacterized protein GSPATT00016153001 [Paramecium tetraurelia]CAK81311.1 unnamed protein product [Paramecium tetraurelia]|eukprot:XP_001448708.1 hypothetical protein (macronuclear) [Paramecium tetraurelia strain d4-2]